jgi:predicted nucleotidyltransferase
MITTSDDLGRVLLGKTRGAVLALLLDSPDKPLHVRQIARLTGAGLGPVQRELTQLARIGILHREQVGRQVFYGVNLECPVLPELGGLVLKTYGAAAVLRDALLPAARDIRVAFIFGSYARGQQRSASDLDVLVVGDISFSAVASALAVAQHRLGREVNLSVYRPGEFAAKIRQHHHFLTAVMDSPKVFVVGDDDELSRLAEERLASPAPDKPAGNRGLARRRRA